MGERDSPPPYINTPRLVTVVLPSLIGNFIAVLVSIVPGYVLYVLSCILLSGAYTVPSHPRVLNSI